MRHTFLLLFSVFLLTPFLWSQETATCYPVSGDYNTGSTDGTDFTQTSLVKTQSAGVEAGWVRFDLSTVPAGAPIQSIELHVYVAVDSYAYWKVMSIESDPLLGTAADVFADCTDGDEYASWSGGNFPEPDWFIADLSASAIATLQNQVSDGWFGISLWEYESGSGYAIECDGWNETNPPYIVVTHAEVGNPFPPYDPAPADEAFEIDIDADLSWTFGDNTENYDVYFGIENPPTTKVIDNEVAGATGMYDPGTMELNTPYYWQVVARNTLAEVAGPVWSYSTACGSFNVPFSENFESSLPPELPNCWNGLVNSSASNAYVKTIVYNGIDDSYCVCMNNDEDLSATLLFVSPALDGGAAGKYVNFFAWAWGTSLSVGTITDPSDESTYNEIGTVTLTNSYQDYQEFEVFFTNYTGTDNYIAFRLYPDVTYQQTYIDNISIDIAPTCPKPSDPYTQETSTNTATIGWLENGDATQWNIEYGPIGFTPTGAVSAVVDANPYVLSGLESSTTYDYYVQADCGGGDLSPWVGPVIIQTQCETQTIPYFEGFEDAPVPLTPSCITVENTNEDDIYWYTDNNAPFNGENHIRISYNYDLAMDDWFFSAPLDLVGGETYIVQFYYTTSSGNYVEQLEVMWGDGNNSGAMTNGPIFQDLDISYSGIYQEGIGYFTPPSDGIYYVGWHGFSFPNQLNIFVDDITIDLAPSCLKPSDVFVTNPTNSSAFINWTENGTATQWNIEYVYSGEAPTGTPDVTAGTNPFEIIGLESGTTYDCYVQADCGGGDLSWWSQPFTFTTLCADFIVPFFEDFSNVSTPEIPDCWLEYETASGTYTGVFTYEWTNLSPPYGLVLENGNDVAAEMIFISPPIADEDGAAGKYINFFAFGYAPEIAVGTMTDPFDPSTFNEITTVSLTSDWQEFEVFFNNYTGNDQFIALKGVYDGTYQTIYIDDITIDHPPSCPKPSDLYTSGSQTNAVTLHWTENGDASLWNVEYGEPGFTPTGVANAIADANPFELTGLDDGTAYEFYVQADCGDGDVSYWVGPVMFQTQCFPAELPYVEDFESILIPPYLPVCMAYENTNGDDRAWESSITNPNSGSFHISIGWNGNLAMDDWFFSAPLDLLGGQTYNVVFYYTTSSDYYHEKMEVKFGMEPTSEGMTSDPFFVDENFAYLEYQEAVTSFSPPEDGTYFIGWHGYSDPNQDYIYLDDIYVEWDNSLIVTATATPDEICEGDESELNGSGVGGTGNYTFSWTSDPAGFTSTVPDPIVNPTETTDYILELNDGMISIYDTVTVVVHAYPSVPGTPTGIGYMCANIANTTYSCSAATGANSYEWSLVPSEAGTISGNGTSISVNWTENYEGTISLKVAGVNNNCVGDFSNPLTIIRYLPEVTLTSFDYVELAWPAFELTGGEPAGGTYSGTGVEDGWFDPSVAGLGDHVITYTYSDVSSCENSEDKVLTVVLEIGINELSDVKVNISPNPNDGLFTLNVSTTSTKAVNIMIVNNYGAAVLEMKNVKLNEHYSTDIDLGNYGKGLYYIKIYSDEINYVEKVIIK